MDFVRRPYYEELLVRYLNLPEVKILKGVRRCGKSTLLLALRERLLAEGVPEPQVLYRSFDEYEVPINADAAWLKAQIDEAVARVRPESALYVLLDEIQTVRGWEDVIRRLYKRENTQVFLTGSNAHLLSSDLATHISGRYIELDVMPLQFKEYRAFCEARGWVFPSEEAMFGHYLTFGGMPGLFQFDQDDYFGKERMLSGIFDTVVMNDVAIHSRVSDFSLLSKLIKYVFSTSGNLLSVKKVADALSAAGKRTAPETVDSYLAALEDALVVNGCEQFGLAGKDILRPRKKYYPIDNGLRNLTSGLQSADDLGFKLEGLVYNQLRAWGFDVKIGSLQKGEVDFVAIKNGKRSYIQVTLSVLDESVFRREVTQLEAVADSFPKTILVMDGFRLGYTNSGVRIQNVIDWCNGRA